MLVYIVSLAVFFFILVLALLVLFLLMRRIILGRFLRWRLDKLQEWGRIIDRIVARLDEPRPAEVHALEAVGPMTRTVLEDALVARVNLMSGNSRIPLIKIFQRTRLLNLCIGDLESRHVAKRRRGTDLLGRAAGRDYASHLIRMLDDPDAGVRIIAARGLGQMGIQVAAPRMVEQFDTMKENECMAMVDALINLGYSSLPSLNEALLRRSEHVKYFAALAISHICEEGRCQQIVMRKMPRRRATDVPFRYPDDLAGNLLQLTWDESFRVRRAVVAALASMQVKRAAPRVERILSGDREATVRVAAAEALSLLARGESAGPLLNALDDPDWDVQCAAARTISALGAPWIGRIDFPPYDNDSAVAWREEIVAGMQQWN